MRLVHPIFSEPLVFEENKVNVLIIENGAFMAKFLCELLGQHKNKEGDFVLSKDFEPIAISKHLEIITDIFSLNLNSRPIMTKLLDELQKKAMNEDFYLKTQAFKQFLGQYIHELLLESDYSLTFEEDINIQNILKSCDVEIEQNLNTECKLLDIILEYCDICTKLLKISCLVFVNLKSFLSNKELALFYEEIQYKKYAILLIENHQEERVELEKIRIIDKDLCEIILD